MLDQFDPFLDKVLLGTFARLPDHKIDGGRAEEQLVCWTVNALAAEIPTVEGDLYFTIGIGHFDGLDLNAVCSRFAFLPRVTTQCAEQATLAHFAFADEDEFGFVEGDLRGGFGAKVGFDSVYALFVCSGEFGIEGVVVEVKSLQMLKLGERGGEVRKIIPIKNQPRQTAEFTNSCG